MRDLLKLFIITVILTIIIFLFSYVFFTDNENQIVEEIYIDPIAKEKIIINSQINNTIKEENIEKEVKVEDELNSASRYYFYYYPSYYKDDIVKIVWSIRNIVENKEFYRKLRNFRVKFYRDRPDVRWKMKNATVNIFWPHMMWETESVAVFMHEFAHFLDLYFLEKKVYTDLSDKFYNISWKSTKIRRSGQSIKDFVSWYSMTNKYEDFAESFTYYVLHNDDFLYKSKKSDFMYKKYKFFQNSFFKNNKFVETDFWENLIIRNYYRDITKIDYDIKKFLQYLKK